MNIDSNNILRSILFGLTALVFTLSHPALGETSCSSTQGFENWGRRPITLSGIHYLAYTANTCWAIERSNTGPDTLRFELRGGDMTPEDIKRNNPSERAEFNQVGLLENNRDIFVSYELFIEPGPATTADWTVLGQFHHTPDIGDADTSPPLAVFLERNDTLTFVTRTYSAKPLIKKPERTIQAKISHFERGKWNKIEMLAHFNPEAPGGLKVWLNGKNIVSVERGLGYRNSRGPYFKFGIYREKSSDYLAVRYRNVHLMTK